MYLVCENYSLLEPSALTGLREMKKGQKLAVVLKICRHFDAKLKESFPAALSPAGSSSFHTSAVYLVFCVRQPLFEERRRRRPPRPHMLTNVHGSQRAFRDAEEHVVCRLAGCSLRYSIIKNQRRNNDTCSWRSSSKDVSAPPFAPTSH